LVEVAAATLHPKSRLGERGMVLNEAWVGNAIGIRKKQVVALGFGESPVEDDVFSKPLIFMPEVTGGAGERGEEPLDHGAGLRAGTVVGDENFSRGSRLSTETGKTKLQRAKVVVGADDHRDLGRRNHTLRGP
jgi:hypothetical protein